MSRRCQPFTAARRPARLQYRPTLSNWGWPVLPPLCRRTVRDPNPPQLPQYIRQVRGHLSFPDDHLGLWRAYAQDRWLAEPPAVPDGSWLNPVNTAATDSSASETSFAARIAEPPRHRPLLSPCRGWYRQPHISQNGTQDTRMGLKTPAERREDGTRAWSSPRIVGASARAACCSSLPAASAKPCCLRRCATGLVFPAAVVAASTAKRAGDLAPTPSRATRSARPRAARTSPTPS